MEFNFESKLDRLHQKRKLWAEEVEVFGGETELTEEDVIRLDKGIAELEKTLKMLQAEARRLLAL